MCGIVGIVKLEGGILETALIKMRDILYHRGPDGAGEWYSPCGRVALAHRRLAVIDLSPGGHQPMVDYSGKLAIVYNGEIYNFMDIRRELTVKGYYFDSTSDTEVILAAYREWGTKCVSRFNGMFAFAIYDLSLQKIFFARDRAGEKPLFYSHQKGELRFASELKALMIDESYPRKIDLQALDCYLAMGYIPGDNCILRDVKKLPPAHAMEFDINTERVKLWCYWQPPSYTPSFSEKCNGENREDRLLAELEVLLQDAVRRQLRADVPVGVLLSGGVDSSLVTAMAVREAEKVKTFTIRFPGYKKYDETEHARLIAKHFYTEHVELEANKATVDLLPVLARQFDEPLVDSSMVPTYLVSKLVKNHCTVVLSGDGGDELFGGYQDYNRLLWTQNKFGSISPKVRNIVAKSAEVLLPIGFKGRVWLQGLGTDFRNELPLVSSYFEPGARRKLMLGNDRWQLYSERIWKERIPETMDLLQRATRMDFNNYLPDDLLVKVDRASMLNSLEVRAPFLDYRVIEFAFGEVSSRLKATTRGRKLLLKKLCKRLLPPQFDQQRKQGFALPLESWLQSGPWQVFFRDTLLNSNNSLFDRKEVNKLLIGQEKGRTNGERLFALVLFELWRQEYKVSI